MREQNDDTLKTGTLSKTIGSMQVQVTKPDTIHALYEGNDQAKGCSLTTNKDKDTGNSPGTLGKPQMTTPGKPNPQTQQEWEQSNLKNERKRNATTVLSNAKKPKLDLSPLTTPTTITPFPTPHPSPPTNNWNQTRINHVNTSSTVPVATESLKLQKPLELNQTSVTAAAMQFDHILLEKQINLAFAAAAKVFCSLVVVSLVANAPAVEG